MQEATATLLSAVSRPITQEVSAPRWRYLILGVVCMVTIANLQYGWTLFVPPLHRLHGWAITEIQISFALFVALETWMTPITGWIADSLGPKWGPRVVMGCGGLLVAVGWAIEGTATPLLLFYAGGAITGLGAGAVYATAVGNAAKWFKDKRGLAIGLTAAGFGAGAAVTIIPIEIALNYLGVSSTFLWFGIVQGGIILIAAQFIRGPYPHEAPVATAAKVPQVERSYTTPEMTCQPVFWVLYGLFLMMAAGGLMAAANLASIAGSRDLAEKDVLFGASALSIGLIFANLMNGIARPLFGWVSDHIGHATTMAIAFALGAFGYFNLGELGQSAWGFIIFTGFVFLCWGEIFSLFPAMCTDLFGPKYATTNLSCLYTAKGAAGFLVPLASLVFARTRSWDAVLFMLAIINIAAVIIVLAVLRPVEARHHVKARSAAPSLR